MKRFTLTCKKLNIAREILAKRERAFEFLLASRRVITEHKLRNCTLNNAVYEPKYILFRELQSVLVMLV